MSAFDLEDLIHVEQDFFDVGYKDGYAHGRIHGLIEGRALGREKGFELWEEIGFYEGFAKLWQAALNVKASPDEKSSNSRSAKRKSPSPNPSTTRTQAHIRHLLDLIAQFPRVNPKPTVDVEGDGELDVSALLSKIRARYKALCANLGIKPRLRPASASPLENATDTVMNLEGISIETSSSAAQRSTAVWRVDQPPGSNEISF
ncbi:hypothetical protein M422DRAFT_46729 [Sphaerobolus stellatus SS14]|uniref:Essential protein Yae1 N-terminal domain-containing protein n=1 Tax=Sphaerobolus stellatus (strain SS14) TaxID=990650 RepID=A0A0C9US58_SPHS4|nr:hypothetical protein M422DRAFT_46729 [Sphaerobolus stellatus SS14]